MLHNNLVIIEAVMEAQSSFEFTSVVGGAGVRRYFQHNRGGLELIFFVLEGGTVYVFAR